MDDRLSLGLTHHYILPFILLASVAYSIPCFSAPGLHLTTLRVDAIRVEVTPD